jgi:hypothetical protein
MKVPRQAHLESAILLALVEGAVDSITELSRRINASRPSTSRAFAALARKGLVKTTGRRRSLTENGRIAAADLLSPSAAVQRVMDAEQRKIQTMVERAQVKHILGSTAMFDTVRMFEGAVHASSTLAEVPAAAIRLASAARANDVAVRFADTFKAMDLPELAFAKRFGQLDLDALGTSRLADVISASPAAGANTLLDGIGRQLVDGTILRGSFADFEIGVGRETMQAFAQIGESVVDRDLFDFVDKTSLLGRELSVAQVLARGAGVAAAVDSVRLQMDALAPAMLARAEWVPLITESVAVNSAIVRDAFTIATFADMTDVGLRKRHARVAAVIEPVIVANRNHTAAELGRIDSESPEDHGELFIAPSIATSRLTGVARFLLDGQGQYADAELPDPGDLFDVLDRHGMAAASRDLRGARDTLVSLPYGWAKTSAHLLREAFREVLVALAPDDQIPNPAKERVTRTMRVNFAIGSDSETLRTLANSAATGWEGMVGFLSSEAHRDAEPRLNHAGMVGVLLAVEGTIRILIAAHDIGRIRSE